MASITVRRRAQLPVIPPVHCPAASRIEGIASFDGAVICGVIANDNAKEDGVGINPYQLSIARGDGGAVLTQKSDPTVVERLCCGTDIPVATPGGHHRSSDGGSRQHYTFCPVWQAEKLRIQEEREQLKGGGLLGGDDDPEPDADPEAVRGRFIEETE